MGRPKLLPKCRNACVAGHRTTIYVEDRCFVVTYCRLCRNAMTDLDLMKPRMQIVQPCALTGTSSTEQ